MIAVQRQGQKSGRTDSEEYMNNEMEVVFDAISTNESFARTAVASFITPLNPTMEDLTDVKTAVSEAVTNAIIHGYDNVQGYSRHGDSAPCFVRVNPGKVRIHCRLDRGILYVDVMDQGKGIADLSEAMEPLFTSRPELERSGMGFSLMEAFMDDLEVESTVGVGTSVHMKKKMCTGDWMNGEE